MTLPPRQQQIIQTHAGIIVAVVKAVQNPQNRSELEPLLETARTNGWVQLTSAIRAILSGQRDLRALSPGLDEEDTVIVEAILRGLQNPATLPDPDASADPAMAAPGLAAMINAARSGDPQAIQWLGHMAEQMTRVGGDMGRLGGMMKRLMDGERNPDVLCKGMTPQGESLVLALLAELGKLELH